MAPNNWTSSQLHDRVANSLRRSEVLEAAYKTTTVGQLVSMRARTHEASPIPQQKRRAFRYSRKVCVTYEGRCRSSRIPPIPHTYSCWAKDIVRHFNGGTAGQFVGSNRFLIGFAGTASLGRAPHQAFPALLAQPSSRAEIFEAGRAGIALFLRRVSPPLIRT